MTELSRDSDRTGALCAGIVIVAFAVIEVLTGGMRLLFSLPAYAILAIAALISILGLRRVRPPPDQFCLWSSAIFVGYIAIRAWFSPVNYVARADIYSICGSLIVYLLVACVLTDARTRMILLLSLLLIGVTHVAIGAIQFRDENNFMLIPFLQRLDYGRRASGFYICPNHLAGFLEVVAVFGLSIAFWSRWPRWSKLLVGYLGAICYAGLMLTGSRGGYLSAIASLLVFVVLSLLVLRQADRKLAWKIGAAGFIATALIAGACLLLLSKSDYLAGRAQTVFEKNVRVDLWSAALKQWSLQPFIGTGAGTYLFFGRQFRTDQVQNDPVEVYNDYLQLLAEYGTVGALAFALFFIAHMRRGWRGFRRLGPMRVAVSSRLFSNALAVNIGAISAVAAYLIHSFVDFNLHVPANALLLAFVFGTLANPSVVREHHPAGVPRALFFWRLIIPALGLVALTQSVRLLPGEYFTERAGTALRDSHPESAVGFALQSLSYERENPDLYRCLGRARLAQAYQIGDPIARESFYQSAFEALENGRAISPRDENFYLDLAYIYDALGRPTEAEWMFFEARALDPRSISVNEVYQGHLARWKESGSKPVAVGQ
jgi:O-antigen ligase